MPPCLALSIAQELTAAAPGPGHSIPECVRSQEPGTDGGVGGCAGRVLGRVLGLGRRAPCRVLPAPVRGTLPVGPREPVGAATSIPLKEGGCMKVRRDTKQRTASAVPSNKEQPCALEAVGTWSGI